MSAPQWSYIPASSVILQNQIAAQWLFHTRLLKGAVMPGSYTNDFIALQFCIDVEDEVLRVGLLALDDLHIESAPLADHVVTCVTLPADSLFSHVAGEVDHGEVCRSYVVCDPGGILRLYDDLELLIEGLMEGCGSVQDLLGEGLDGDEG